MITEPITNKPTIWAEVDANGRLIIPPDLASRYGLQPGERVRLQPGENDLRLHRAVGNLAKIYIEPTNRCNLDCLTCMRHNWDVTMGRMSAAVFERILAGIREIDPPPTVFFGGVGEPLFHPRTPEMVAAVKAAVEAGTRGAEKVGEVVSVHVIPRPHANVDTVMPLGRQESGE